MPQLVTGDICIGPCGNRVDLDDITKWVKLDHLCRGSRRRIITSQAGHPRMASLEQTFEWSNFSNGAACIGVKFPELDVWADALGLDDGQLATRTMLYVASKRQGLLEQKLGVKQHHFNERRHTPCEVRERRIAKARCHHHVMVEIVVRPFDNCLG